MTSAHAALTELVAVLTSGKALIDSHHGDGSYVGFSRELMAAIRKAESATIVHSQSVMTEAIAVLDLVVAEWNSDPMSVQCFDLRTVRRGKEVIAQLKKND